MTRTGLIATMFFAVGAQAADDPVMMVAGPPAEIQTAAYATDPVDGLTVSEVHTVALAADDMLVVRNTEPRVCDPTVVDNRAKLDPDCINRIVNLGVRKGRYRAQTREKRPHLRSLCENTWLPRCRHKY